MLVFQPYHRLNKIISSIDFLSEMITRSERPYHYYNTTKKQWFGKGDLQDLALLAKLFQKSGKKFKNKKYHKIASKIVEISILEFYNKKKRIFVDPELDENDYEYLMGINSIFASILLENQNYLKNKKELSIKSTIAYFSGLNELLEDRFWDGKDWYYLENYALFLSTTEKFLHKQKNL